SRRRDDRSPRAPRVRDARAPQRVGAPVSGFPAQLEMDRPRSWRRETDQPSASTSRVDAGDVSATPAFARARSARNTTQRSELAPSVSVTTVLQAAPSGPQRGMATRLSPMLAARQSASTRAALAS